MLSFKATPVSEPITVIENDQDDITFAVVPVDPDQASYWLENNEANRNIRPARVTQYAQDMAADEWKLTGEPIKFDKFGHLLDGQHRLHAVVASGATVPMLVASGVDPEARQYMDTGAARTASDAVKMRNEKSPAVLAAAARLGYLIENNLHTSVRISHAQTFAWIDAHPNIRTAAVAATGAQHKIDLAQSMVAYTRFRMDEIDPFVSDVFWSKLANLNDLPNNDPILRLAHRLRQRVRNGEEVSKRSMVITIFRTWNAWRDGRTTERVQFANSDAVMPDLR